MLERVHERAVVLSFKPTQTGLFAHYITGGELINSLIFNHYLTLNFPQYFFDLSLIRFRKKNQNGGIFLMTS